MNISPLTVTTLQRVGYTIVRVSDLLPANAPDLKILQLARERKMVLVTQDIDFSTLLALGGHASPSVVTVRLSNSDPAFVAHRLQQVLPVVEVRLGEGCAVTVDDLGVRVRSLPIRK